MARGLALGLCGWRVGGGVGALEVGVVEVWAMGGYKQDRADHPQRVAPPRGPTNKRQEVERQKQAFSAVVCFVRALMFRCMRAHLSARFKGLT